MEEKTDTQAQHQMQPSASSSSLLSANEQSPSAYVSAESSPSNSITNNLNQAAYNTNNSPNSNKSVKVMLQSAFTSLFSSKAKESEMSNGDDQATKKPQIAASDEHREKMQQIAIGIREYAFGKDNSPRTADSADARVASSSSLSNTTTAMTSPTQFSFSLIDKMLARTTETSSNNSTASPLANQNSINSSTLSAASSSSPNPNFSPFKLLDNEHTQASSHIVSTTTTMIANAAENSKLMESLSSLTNKEDHEKVDPILSTAATFKSSSTSTQSPLPSTSQEFCMNLNLNMAKAAAVVAPGPVFVVNTNKLSNNEETNDQQPTIPSTSRAQYNLEHSKFTSNASTSSIHSDLNKILDVNSNSMKMNEDQQAYGERTPSMIPTDELKSDRQSYHDQRSVHELQKSNDKMDVCDLTKMFKMLIESKKRVSSDDPAFKSENAYRYSKDLLIQIRDDRSNFIDKIYPDIFNAFCYCMNGKYWDPEKYFDIIQFTNSDERIQNVQQKQQQVRQRKNFKTNNNQFRVNNHSYNGTQPTTNSQQYQQHHANQAKPSLNLFTTGKHVLNDSPQFDSPQPLIVPKNSPRSLKEDIQNSIASLDNKTKQQYGNKVTTSDSIPVLATSTKSSFFDEHFHTSNQKKQQKPHQQSSTQNVLASLGLNTRDSTAEADKALLNLIKTSQAGKQNDEDGLLSVFKTPLGAKKESKVDSVNMLASIMMPKKSALPSTSQPSRHVYSVQELEKDQMSKQSHQQSPKQQQQSKQAAKASNDPLKQLVKNMKKDSTTTKKPAQQQQQQQQQQQAKSDHNSNILKLLLNVKPSSSPSTEETSKSSKHRHRHGKYHHNKSSDAKASETSQFPATNPHEMPFDQNKCINSSLDQLLSGKPMPTPIDNFLQQLNEKNMINKIMDKKLEHYKNENDHFNSLISKISSSQTPQQQSKSQQAPTNKTDVLKWFTAPSNQTLGTLSQRSSHDLEVLEKLRQKPVNIHYY